MDIPEDWALIDHPDGGPVLTVDDGRYMYMSFLPMFTDSLEPDSDWTSDRADMFVVQVLDKIQYEKVEMKIVAD
jgi:hypothetical protein